MDRIKLSWCGFILALCMLLPTMAMAKDDASSQLNYTIEGAGTGNQGTYLVKVTVISKKSKIANDLVERAAVHGVLFRGFANKETRQSQRPLAGSAQNEAQHADFYTDFFKENGMASQYASEISGSRQVVKSGKEYRITSTVSVDKERLHSDLEKAGIIKGLTSGF